MAEAGKPKTSTITLDQATRARVVKELGLAGGVDAIPAEITFVAVDKEEAGYKEPEVAGYAAGVARGVFVNSSLTPSLVQKRILGGLSGNALKVAVPA